MAKTQHQRWPTKALWSLEESDDLAAEATTHLEQATEKLEKALRHLRSNPDSAELFIVYAQRHIADAKADHEQIRRVLSEARQGKDPPIKD